MSFDIYREVTSKISALLAQGVVPWRSPILGQASGGVPKNIETKRTYRGVNVFLLAITAYVRGYSSAYWLTFRQAQGRGGTVKRGERSTMVVFWKQFDVVDKKTGEPSKIPVLRYYNVFNVEQCEGLTPPDAVPVTPTAFTPCEAAEHVVQGFVNRPMIEHGGTQAFYRPSTDEVRLPEPSRFSSGEAYYSTLFHELAHSTGHCTRLDRKLEVPKPFGSIDYGKEELVAEMAAAFLCGHVGISPSVIEDQASYIDGWLKRMKEDTKLIVHAAGQAQRAADWILGERPNATEDATSKNESSVE